MFLKRRQNSVDAQSTFALELCTIRVNYQRKYIHILEFLLKYLIIQTMYILIMKQKAFHFSSLNESSNKQNVLPTTHSIVDFPYIAPLC